MRKRLLGAILAVAMVFNMEGIAEAAAVTGQTAQNGSSQSTETENMQTDDQGLVQTMDQLLEQTADQEDTAAEDETDAVENQTEDTDATEIVPEVEEMDQTGETAETEENPYSSLAFSKSSLTLAMGETASFTMTTALTDSSKETDDTIVYTSSDASVATVSGAADGTGNIVITAVASGTVTITATAGTALVPVTDTVTVTVRAPKTVSITGIEQTAYNKAVLTYQADTSKDADGYVIERKAQGETAYTVLSTITDTTKTSYTCTKLTTGIKYTYRIRSYILKSDGTTKLYGSYSATSSITTVLDRTVLVSAASASYKSVKLIWSKTTGASGYQIYRSTSKNGTYKKIATVSYSKRSYTDTGLATGTKYYYYVRAYRNITRPSGVKAVRYSANSVVKSAKPAMAQPKVTSTKSAAYNAIKLTWKKVAGASGYAIYRSTSKNGTYKRVGTVTSSTKLTYTDKKSIKSGVTYYYKIRVYRKVSGKSVYSPYSNSKTGKAIPATAKIASVSSSTYNTLTIKWKKVTGASGYQVYYATKKNGTYKRAATLKGNGKVTYTIKNVKSGTRYYVKVRAYRTVNGKKVFGSFSSIKYGTPRCAKPTGLKAVSVNGNKVKLTWKKVAGAQTYTVLRSTSKNGTYKVIKSKITKLTYTNSKLEDGVTYYYKIYAVRNNTVGNYSSAVAGTSKSLAVGQTSVSMYAGEVFQINMQIIPMNTVRWTSDNSGVATVSGTGLVTACAIGTTYVHVYGNGFVKSIKIKVKARMDGIDVSRWQEDIDWSQVANDGIDFAMLRIWHSSQDTYFEQNYSGARANGIKTGVYCYSDATTVDAAAAEAQTVINVLNGRTMEYPVVLDMENSNMLGLTNEERTNMIFAFKNVVEANGYKFALYANTYWLEHYIDNSRLAGVDLWVAKYVDDTTVGHGYTGGGNVVMWQYTSSGSVAGISGRVDRDYGYKAY